MLINSYWVGGWTIVNTYHYKLLNNQVTWFTYVVHVLHIQTYVVIKINVINLYDTDRLVNDFWFYRKFIDPELV